MNDGFLSWVGSILLDEQAYWKRFGIQLCIWNDDNNQTWLLIKDAVGDIDYDMDTHKENDRKQLIVDLLGYRDAMKLIPPGWLNIPRVIREVWRINQACWKVHRMKAFL